LHGLGKKTPLTDLSCADIERQSGWKLIHGDVFRFPQHPEVFCAAVGTGNQLMVLTLFHLTLALMNIISTTRRGSILAGVVVLYCLTSCVGGYTAVRLFRQMNGKNWVHCILLQAALFPAPVVFVFSFVNSLALAHGSTSALPVTALLTVAALYVFVSFPLTVVGGILAKNFADADFDAPTRTTKVAREIPTEIPFYRGRYFQVLIAGFLPFSAIYIELHYIFASMWGHQIYTLFGILFLAFILLVIVTSFITVALLYFQLAREDHEWWWTTYVNGGMTGIFIYVYSFYFYFHRSGMSGILQGSFYFGYMSIVSLAFFLMLGAAGFQFSLIFVRYIYSRIKSD
jgi:Endomembrane protein 70